MADTSRLKVCIVAINAYPAIDDQVPGTFGGIETRSWLMARALARLPDLEVSFVVRHWAPLRQNEYEGVKLHLIRDRLFQQRDSLLSRLERTSGFPGFKLRHPHLSDAFYLPLLAGMKFLRGKNDPLRPSQLLQQIDCDLFLSFGVQSHSATVISSAHSTDRPAVLFLGSDSDLDERYMPGNNYTSVYRDSGDICYHVIQEADEILCQTPRQRELLSSRFDRNGTVIPNPIDLEQWDRLAKAPIRVPLESTPYALWVGRADPVHKQPQHLIELAKLCPEVRFLMIMNPRDDVCEARIRETAASNVQIVDRVPFSEMPALYNKASMFINTSSLEGFPNTFLQAAASAIPVLSLNVEGEFLERTQAGFCANGDLNALADHVRTLWSEPQDFSQARRYVEQHHNIEQTTRLLADSLRSTYSSWTSRTL
ncbi:Glycosyl transferases group 1 [Thalassoglobus neptunius]|uniref:Glycosyl transferases group 1 n=1 Tax=Thalassoglobus neptunius TaxID=1938619 RepID=A0A5C5X4G6_9PLAN|nr:glycosyltransferase family 4 protein [Thalassoglobus neptunius]TWT57479.1 Glycosyl transferases group 1 [Thalassoglobus neptunius]